MVFFPPGFVVYHSVPTFRDKIGSGNCYLLSGSSEVADIALCCLPQAETFYYDVFDWLKVYRGSRAQSLTHPPYPCMKTPKLHIVNFIKTIQIKKTTTTTT